MTSNTIQLYRPIGQAEHDLIAATGFTAFPPRLPDQPFFYPVTNEVYAIEIARDWNSKEPSGRGYVTRFEVRADVLARYQRKIVGAARHEEYWIPADDLPMFNAAIVGTIEIIGHYTAADRIAYETSRS